MNKNHLNKLINDPRHFSNNNGLNSPESMNDSYFEKEKRI